MKQIRSQMPKQLRSVNQQQREKLAAGSEQGRGAVRPSFLPLLGIAASLL